jgi:hypothetical protein
VVVVDQVGVLVPVLLVQQRAVVGSTVVEVDHIVVLMAVAVAAEHWHTITIIQ